MSHRVRVVGLLVVSVVLACGRSPIELPEEGAGGVGGLGGGGAGGLGGGGAGSGCIPAPEACNGLDDNCNGFTDEGCDCVDGAAQLCGVGACEGIQRCAGGFWGECTGVSPEPEVCNGLDDDCDGSADESCACQDGSVQTCGSNVGACEQGAQLCAGGVWGTCEGAIDPLPEACNGVDDDCDGAVDEGFGLGQACDGPDTDLCADDVMTCAGCSKGADNIEACNGGDDDCDGVIDEGCGGLPCGAGVVVLSVTASSPGCFVDAVIQGEAGTISFPCDGGGATLALGDLNFSGAVVGGQVTLAATTQYVWTDGCTWQTSQHITGSLGSGTLAYAYSEMPISGSGCSSVCTATGKLSVP